METLDTINKPDNHEEIFWNQILILLQPSMIIKHCQTHKGFYMRFSKNIKSRAPSTYHMCHFSIAYLIHYNNNGTRDLIFNFNFDQTFQLLLNCYIEMFLQNGCKTVSSLGTDEIMKRKKCQGHLWKIFKKGIEK